MSKLPVSRPPERLPERSEIVSGKDAEGSTPISAAQSKKTKQKIAENAKAEPKGD